MAADCHRHNNDQQVTISPYIKDENSVARDLKNSDQYPLASAFALDLSNLLFHKNSTHIFLCTVQNANHIKASWV